MRAIGGYFELELPRYEEYHKDAIRLNTGRNCLEYILRTKQYSKVYLPCYTCQVQLEPFIKLHIPYDFYSVDLSFEMTEDISLQENEALLYTNFYGLKQSYTERLAIRYGKHLIVDNTQAFFAKPIKGIDTFYSCRKFFGVPDGAYLYTDCRLGIEIKQDLSYDRMTFLNKRIDLSPEAGYADFQHLTKSLVGQPIRIMSQLTHRLMQGIDYACIASRRRANYRLLHDALEKDNRLKITLEDDAVPMVYPYLTFKEGLRERLIENKIYIARYWPNVLEWSPQGSIDHILASQLLPIPIDQRYGEEEMKRIIQTIEK